MRSFFIRLPSEVSQSQNNKSTCAAGCGLLFQPTHRDSFLLTNQRSAIRYFSFVSYILPGNSRSLLINSTGCGLRVAKIITIAINRIPGVSFAFIITYFLLFLSDCVAKGFLLKVIDCLCYSDVYLYFVGFNISLNRNHCTLC